MLKNWKQLFLSKLILYFLGQEYDIYFSFLTYIFLRYLRNIHEKKFWTHENTHEKKLWTHEGMVPRWHKAHETHDGTKPRNLAHSFFFLISDFLHKVSKPTKTSEKNHLSYSTVSLKKPHSFYKSRLTRHWKYMLPHYSHKPFSLYKFFSKHLVDVKKNIGTALVVSSSRVFKRRSIF